MDGKLTVFFTVDSYVGVKSSDNLNWYMTDGYLGQVTSATLYNAENIATEDKLFIPANKIITFTLVDNGDDTYLLSYEAADCPHESHSVDGICTLCGSTVEHSYVEGVCACGKACSHVYTNGVCGICGMGCEHNWRNGVCQICSISCSHSWVDGVCSICSVSCKHSYVEGECSTCGKLCDHSWTEGVCDTCGVRCVHTYQNNICTNCGFEKPATDYYLSGTINGEDYAWGSDAANVGEMKFVDGTLTVIFRQDSYIAVRGDKNVGWYMTDGDQGQATSVTLYNASNITDGQLLWVPGCMQITFTLVDNGDDTLTLSYTAVDCPHVSHDTDGVCADCGQTVAHSYDSVVTDPTCTEDGYTTHTCIVCGISYTDSQTAATGHSYGSVTTDPTCTQTGSIVYTCHCGDSYSETIPALGHSYESVTTDPTCTQEGKTVYTCSVCGDSYSEAIAAPGHSYESVVTEPTCTENGYTTHTCCVCGDSYTDSEVAALGHSWVDPSCTVEKTCSVCGATEGAALGHSYESVTTDPTCTEAGYTTHTCTVCGDSYTDGETAALGHSWLDATCTEKKTCCVCGTTEGEALGHSYDSVVTEPTCTEAGYTTYTCSVCGDSYIDSETAALGHDYEAVTTDPTCTEDGKTVYTCAACGDSYTEMIAALGHSYDSVVTAPTCTEEGYTTHTCTVCGDTYTDSVVAALGHSYDSVVTAPTCTETGYTTHTCTVCGDTYTDSETAALGHSWVDATCTEAKTCSVCGETEGEALGHSYDSVVTEPTCTETGYTTHTCSACGVSYTDSETAALGHSYVGVTTDPTCTEDGKTVYTCSACGDSYTEMIAALGHSYDSVITAPTCTEGGYTTHTCTVCGDTYTDSETDANGHSYDLTIHEATCTEYADYEYICSACGDYYIFHAEDLKDWMTEIPEGIDPSLFESKTEYRYRDYDKVVTDATSMDGYDLIGSEWMVVGSGTVYYVKDWSTGFDTTHSLYSQYDNIGDKVAAYETETGKLVIDSDEIVGHLFFHWCYANSYYSAEWKTTKYTDFCAYYDAIVDLSELWCDTSDMSYYTSYDNCADSPWYFVDEVYGQSYTEYQKQFTYERWTDWSDWSETEVTASATREVESRTYYRLAGVELADHSYEAVVTAPTCTEDGFTTHTCSVCGDSYTDSEVAATGHSYESVTTDATCTEDGSIVYTCACGDTYTETIDALGHSYEAVVTAPTCTEDGFTTHTCSVCGDSYTDSGVAATGHSYESVTTDATCTEDGSIVYTCACGDTYTETIPALGHSYESVTTEATCTEDGSVVYTCACGDSYTETIAATGHSYVDGICSICGSIQPETVVQPTLSLSYGSVSFESEILYNIYFNASELDSVVEMGMITFDGELAGGTIDDALKVYSNYSTDGTLYMVATDGIAAKNMADQMWFKIYAKLSDGSYVYTDLNYYSAVRYATSILERDSSSDYMKALVVAMLNYGAEAQLYFGHNTDALANASLTAEQKALNVAYDETMVADVVSADAAKSANFVYTESAFTTRYSSVSFDSAFSINFYFTSSVAPDDGMTFYYWDIETYDSVEVLTKDNATGTMEMALADTNKYYGVVEGIAAKEIDETVFVAGVYEVDGVEYTTGIIAYSLGKYCETIAAKDTSDQQAFAQATAVYGYYAKEYFANL